MATSLKPAAPALLRILIVGAACALCSFSSVAEEPLNDPTRPAVVLVPGLGGSGSTTDLNMEDKTPPQGLQSVFLSKKHEAAIINGIEVAVGQKYEDAVLTEVNETCVVLMGPHGRKVLHMFPTVNMTKNELACKKQQGMQSINQVAGEPAKNNKAKKKAKLKKRVVTCVPDENKNGSKK
jgi:hypothetical protein